jgi:hypothetical protein
LADQEPPVGFGYLENDILNKSLSVRVRKVALWVGLLAFVSGCSGYRTAVIPGVDDPFEQPPDDAPVLAEGMQAKVHLLTGETLEGEVVGFDSEILTIGRVGNYGFEETNISFTEVARVDVEAISKATGGVARAGGTVLMVLAALLVTVMIVCAVSDCDFAFENN